ncbi:thrombospondin type-1 domain-containing protein 7B [Anabrus simplex]|uniref:thrombospondin type-1 domain-containing protein 7B n=1 Tax=Anabrus simplex TaxID=316456 RepID=UPI0035A27A88
MLAAVSGSWGTCYATPGVCGEGRRERSVWCSEPEGRTVLEFLCEPQAEPPRSKPCFVACRHHKDKLQWQVGTWGPCLPVSAANRDDLQGRENMGVTQRNVSCVLVSHDSVKLHRVIDEENCFTVARKPDPVRFCHIPRPQDCVVGPFSEWSSCSGCSGDGSEDGANQTRVRTVLVAPMNGGRPCPQLTETRPCDPRAECLKADVDGTGAPPEYKLKLGEWRRCQAPTSLVPADVLEARAHGRDISLHSNSIYQGNVIGAGGNPGVFPVSGGSSSEAVESYFTFQPQVGYQTREVSCRDSKGAVVDLSLCLGEEHPAQLPARVRPCVVPQDCVVNQWSPWTRIQDGCVASSGRTRPEVHERKREVVRLQEGDGQPCPHLVETRQTTDRDQLQPCAQKYKWLASKWSPCVVTADDSSGPRMMEVGCGGGVQLREVTCVAIQGGQPVPQELCASLEPLPTVQRCEVACPRDCEVGEWGAWGPCRPLECPQFGDPPAQGYRERRRTVEVLPSEQGLPCPSVKEVQPCPQPACHTWSEGSWGPCELDPGVKHCGEGRRSRGVSCRALYGVIVDDSMCLRRQVKPPGDEPCLLPCPYDCVLSPWSSWSPCSHSCSSPRQVALRQRNRTVIAPPGPGGHSCPDPDEMLQIEPCNTHSCNGYSWLALPWQICHSPPDNTTTDAPPVIGPDQETLIRNGTLEQDCGHGIQEREVWCMEANDKRVEDWRCEPLPRPNSVRSCSRPCPIDCQMSPWSEWSPCPQQCVPDASNEIHDGEVTPTQTRHRVVIQWPANGGSSCAHLEELRPCPLSGARCKHYLWGTGPWSDCQLPTNVECGVGYRTRAVWCYRNHRSTKVEPSLCIEHNGTVPSQSEPCYVDCQWPCVLSHWSEWSPCSQACTVRLRTRQLLGLSSTREYCKNTTLFPQTETAPCPCDRYTLQPQGDWSECILERDINSVTANGRPAPSVCGSGSRFRRAGCYDKDNNLVEPSLCGAGSGLQEEPCFVPCPTDCVLSEWSPWGECSTTCGPGMHNRTRQVIRPSLNSGRPCGALEEFKVCVTPCETFQWVAGGWSECQLIGADQNRGCGTGDQYRQVRCMQLRPHALPTEMHDLYCDPIYQPADVNACHVACPGDCVLSPWSDWSECPKPCTPSNERQRTRSVLRKPANNAAKCPPLIEVQPCQLNVTCFTYSWRATEYSSCLPLGGSPCGEGVQSRAVFCQRSDGRPVEDRFCSEQERPAPTEKWCYVDCPVDCEVTNWSPWNTSECQCGSTGSKMLRYRYIVTNPSQKGRPCPLPLVQHKPCPALPCYAWERGQWSSCDLHGAWCGHGIISRNVTCLRNGQPVEPRLCANVRPPGALDLRAVDSCYVPCRGDCQVSEWSHWSHCHRNCQGPDVGGYQTRSRAVLKPPAPGGEPCPTALWETRPCFTGPCLTFDWIMTEDGSITCQRSDGVIVVGGCDGKPKPCASPSCDSVAHAHCDTQLGQCTCAPGYEAQFELADTPHRRLAGCVPTVMADTTATDTLMRHRVRPGDVIGVTETIIADDEIQSRFYYPKDDDINVWMFAMIGIGCIFIVFVAVSIYLMCNGSYSREGDFWNGAALHVINLMLHVINIIWCSMSETPYVGDAKQKSMVSTAGLPKAVSGGSYWDNCQRTKPQKWVIAGEESKGNAPHYNSKSML